MILLKTCSSDKAGENQKAKSLSKRIKYPAGFEAYLTDNVLSKLAIYRVGEKKIFYSCCGKFEDFAESMERPRSGNLIPCPHCGKSCRGIPYTSTITDNSGVLISWLNGKGDTVYMAVIDVWRRYKAEWENLKEQGDLSVGVQPIAIYIAKKDQQEAFVKGGYYGWRAEKDNVWSLEAPTYAIQIQQKSFEKCIPKSFLKYTETMKHLKDMSCQSLIKYIFFSAKYPQAEYIEKMGLGSTVLDKVYSRRTYGAVNWKKSTPQEMLGLCKEGIREALQSIKNRDSAKVLATAKRCYKEGWKVNAEELRDVTDLLDLVDDKEILKNATIKKVYRYIEKQYEKNMPCCGQGVYGYTKNVVKRDYVDYISEATEIGYDLDSDYFRFPQNLSEAHRISGEISEKRRQAKEKSYQAEVKAQKQKEESALKRKMKDFEEKILRKLMALEYSDGNLTIIPARSESELQEESRQLGHCVGRGGYWRGMVEGKIAIFFIRSAAEAEKSFYTLELKNATVLQCRGKSNCNMTEEVTAFVDGWKRNVLNKLMKQKKRTKAA